MTVWCLARTGEDGLGNRLLAVVDIRGWGQMVVLGVDSGFETFRNVIVWGRRVIGCANRGGWCKGQLLRR